ncbi:MAG: HAMP domain-containing protein [bacterium]|nr:HAMP domain-containing protein [bacterium]
MRFRSVKSRLIFWFLLVALLPLLVVTLIIYTQRVRSIKEEAFSKLRAIRDLKVEQVHTWLAERVGDIRALSGSRPTRALGDLLEEAPHSASPRDARSYQYVRQDLGSHLDNIHDYHEIFIIGSASGAIEFSTDVSQEGRDKSEDPYFTEPMRTGQVFIKDVYFSTSLKRPSMAFSAPIFCLAHDGEHIAGILVARVHLARSLYSLLLNRTGMGRTGETLIVNEDVVALNELRWFVNAPLELKIKAEPAVRASGGERGITETEDYRGEKVLAAYTYIPETRWGFVAKQDLQEVYAPIRLLLRHVLVLLVVSAGLVYGLALFLARSIARPVVEMAETSKKIQQGDLSSRNRIRSADELGLLAETFNNMAESIASQIAVIKNSEDQLRQERDSLEEQVRKRTLALRQELDQRQNAEAALRASLREKEVLLREIHHRVKNNMQVIISLLKLQSARIEDPQARDMFKDSRDRIKTMALVHEKLYRSRDLANIDFNDYINDLIKSQLLSYGIGSGRISPRVEVENVALEIDLAIPCGLIINELVSNALKHAFPQDRSGEIRISLRVVRANEFELSVGDDGIGVPDDVDLKNADSFGLYLVRMLAEHQLDGQITFDRTAGTTYHIHFKRPVYSMKEA